jgi:hypothetical protein
MTPNCRAFCGDFAQGYLIHRPAPLDDFLKDGRSVDATSLASI